MLVTLDLAPYPASVGEARRFAVSTLTSWGREDLTGTAALVVTELVTNAVLHAKTAVQLCLERLADSRVRVEVRDGSKVRPSLRYHGLDATTGRGLALVSQLAESWGVDVGANGKSVWLFLNEESDDELSGPLASVPDLEEAEPDVSDGTGPTGPVVHGGEALSRMISLLGSCA